MTFKGTKRRSKEELERFIEQRGAHMNAYTTKEYVAYFSNCLSTAAGDMLKLILEILEDSNLTSAYLDEEKFVVLRELEEVERIGEEALFDRIHAQIFPSHALGRTILGTPGHIKAMTKQRLTKFVQKHYTPKNMILIAAGDVNAEEIESIASKVKSRKGASTGEKEHPVVFKPGLRCFVEPSDDPVLEGPIFYIAQTSPTVAWNDPKCVALTLARSMLACEGDEAIYNERALQGSRARVPTTLTAPTSLDAPVFFDAYYRQVGIAGWYLLHSPRDMVLADKEDYLTLVANKQRYKFVESAMVQNIEEAYQTTVTQVRHKIETWTEEDLREARNSLLSLYDQTCDTSGALCEEQTRQIMTRGRLVSMEELEQEIMSITLEEVKEIALQVFAPPKDKVKSIVHQSNAGHFMFHHCSAH
eukprot:Protomagalhaensia_sp_Gyna_25__4872@NODE_50_length_6124_cov_50_591454_g37_i0_p2_GENE_NODE_50_length_6124_cov_50_591454_g37_i0NODE_50_length_6124_cov_50_591454_g37_i0_p2_ORF_typecomplete_len417_score72_78Peptidase_M16/PF00675_20/1_4e19Peptidase_M16/PF00675_20/5_2e03Peptidase_M16_C/PF05193_21/1_8e10Peptidase_M16_C/PF05193_21/3_8e02M16C_assoc/PF08367_11/0_012M16C_assoc/PF08367_11/6e03M16C_assoc/PF08367_11/7e03_NODE_50_length_6124_cov_50_591454_g37_i0561306